MVAAPDAHEPVDVVGPRGAVQLRGIVKSFDGARVLDGVDFDLRSGEVHVLAGENGAGKSTLLKILCGVHQPDAGEIAIRGERVRFRSVLDAHRAGIAMIHQELSLAPSMSVSDNLFLGRERVNALRWLDRRGQRSAARAALDRVGLHVDPATIVGSLPLAAQQLIEIAKALLRDASVLIMDEPTSALPRPDVERLFALIGELTADAKRPVAVVYISHRMEEIYRIADRITVLRDGRLVRTANADELPRDALVQAMVGRAVTDDYASARGAVSAGAGDELLRLERVSVAGRRGLAVHDVSLTLRAGEIVGLAGLSGSGTGELMSALFGEGTLAGGAIVVAGALARVAAPRNAMRLGIALVTDDRKTTGLNQGLSVGSNLTLPSIETLSPLGWRRAGRERSTARDAIRRFTIRCRSAAQIVRTLSGGNQQKVALGKWLLRNPRVLLLNDPTRGVDVGARQEIYALIREATRNGAAVLLTSGDLPELLGLSDRVVVMHRGRVTARFERSDATPERVIAAAMGDSGADAEVAA